MADAGLSLKGNYLQHLPAGATLEQISNVVNSVIDALNNQLQQQIFSDGKNKRMLIGYQKDGWGPGKDFGRKVSIEGIDVTEATDEQLLFKESFEEWTWRDNNGNLIKVFDILNGVTSEYSAADGTNYMQTGKLPDATYGWAIARSGFNVADGIF